MTIDRETVRTARAALAAIILPSSGDGPSPALSVIGPPLIVAGRLCFPLADESGLGACGLSLAVRCPEGPPAPWPSLGAAWAIGGGIDYHGGPDDPAPWLWYDEESGDGPLTGPAPGPG